MIKLSVVIPTFRRPDLLARCLWALTPVCQNIPEDSYEIIIADDEDSPETRSLAKRILPKSRYVKGPGRGPAANRNCGSSHASGHWLVFTDDDCIPGRGWLQAYLSAIRDGCRIYEGRTVCREGLTSPLHTAPINESGGWLWSCNFMIERHLFFSLGAFDESFPFPFAEDVDLRERIRDNELPFDFVPEALVDHPPRKFKGLREILNQHRSGLYLQVVKRRSKPTLRKTLRTTVACRIRSCFRPAIRDLPNAIAIYVTECVWLCLRFQHWRKKVSMRVQ